MATYKDVEPIKQFIVDRLNSCEFGYDAIEILAEVEYAPTADVVEVKHGEWLHKKVDKSNWYVYGQCSKCLERNRIGNYCRNCGAKMDGDKTDG